VAQSQRVRKSGLIIAVEQTLVSGSLKEVSDRFIVLRDTPRGKPHGFCLAY